MPPPPEAMTSDSSTSTSATALSVRVFLGLIAGLALGLWFSTRASTTGDTLVGLIAPVGALWVNAIRMTVIPLLVALLIGGIASAGAGTVSRVGGRTLAWFVGLAGVSALVGGLLAGPVLDWLGAGAAQVSEVSADATASTATLPPFSDWFVGLLPANPVAAAASGDVLPLILFSVLFGLAATRLAPESRQRIEGAARAVSEAMFVIIGWILAVAPIGVFALAVGLAARTGASLVGAVAGFVATTAILVTVVTALLYPLVGLFSRSPVRLFARAAAPAQAVGFSTRSSLATLPILVEEAERTLRLRPEVSGLTLPAAVSVFKYASPVVRLTGTFFVARLFGVDLGAAETVALVAGIGALSFYSPGIPSGGLFVMGPLYQAFGLPLEGIGMLIALDIVPDMFITASNVTANLAVATLVDQNPRSAHDTARTDP